MKQLNLRLTALPLPFDAGFVPFAVFRALFSTDMATLAGISEAEFGLKS